MSIVLRLIFVLSAALLAPPASWAEFRIAQQWRAAEGLPVDSANSVAIDGRGLLWIATHDGVARFDGRSFEHFNTENTPGMPGNRAKRVFSFGEQGVVVEFDLGELGRFNGLDYLPIGTAQFGNVLVQDGQIWFISSTGLVAWSPADGPRAIHSPPIQTLVQGRHAKELLLGTVDGRILAYDIAAGGIEMLAALPGGRILALGVAPDGSLAAGIDDRLLILSEDAAGGWVYQQSRLTPKGRFQGNHLKWTPEGWLITNMESQGLSGPARLHGDRLTPLNTDGPAGFQPKLMTRRDSAGKLWENNGHALVRQGQRVFHSEYAINDFTFDRYGQVWLATVRGGIQRLVDAPLRTVGEGPGELVEGNTYHASMRGDDLLVGEYAGLFQFSPSTGTWRQLSSEPARSALDDDGGLLIGGNGVCRLQAGGNCTPLGIMADSNSLVSLLFRDRSGAVWLGSDEGFFRRDPDGRWLGPLAPGVHGRAALELPDGSLLLATVNHGVFVVAASDPERRPRLLLDHHSGLPSNRVRALWSYPSGELLVGMEDQGLCLYAMDAGVQRCISTPEGLPHHSVHRIIADDSGRLWVNTNGGIYSIPARQLLDYLLGRTDTPSFRIFGVEDGMASIEGNGGVGSAGTRAPDGRIWFPNQRGLVMIDPAAVRPKAQPLDASIETSATVVNDTVTIRPGRRSLRVRLNSIALRGDDLVHFRYRMDPDSDWTVTGDQRELAFESLAPGKYSLEVQARYLDGDWDGKPAVLAIAVPPQLMETGWFWALVGFAALALLGTALAQARAQGRRLDLQVTERTRELQSALVTVEQQARDLHEAATRRHKLFLTISHELRTPLTTILGPLDTPGVTPGSVQLARMRRSAVHMREMLEQILRLEHMHSDQVFARRSEPLARLLRQAIEPFQAKFSAAEIRLDSRLSESVDEARLENIRIEAEPTQLQLAVAALLDNALKYATRPGGQVTVRVCLEKGESAVRIDFDDDGPGVPAADRQRIFEAFETGPGEAAPGLGLTLCRRIIEQHGGTLSLHSSPLGGARFSISLPVAGMGPLDEPGLTEGPEDARVILVVDDNPDIRAHVSELLEDRYRVLEARDGVEGLRIATANLPDLMIVDIAMPRMTGLELVKRLRTNDDTAAIPVIFMTAYGIEEYELQAFRSGGDQFLEKPFGSEQLLARIERMLTARETLLREFDGLEHKEQSQPSTSPAWVERLTATIEAHVGDADLDVPKLAAAMGMSRSALYRRLEQELGLNPAEYIRRYRLDRATALLRGSDARVSEIAYALGFRRLSAFTRGFSAQFGCSPTTFRRTARQEQVEDRIK